MCFITLAFLHWFLQICLTQIRHTSESYFTLIAEVAVVLLNRFLFHA